MPAIDHPKPVAVGHVHRAPTGLVAKPAAAVNVKPATTGHVEGKAAAAVHVKHAATGRAELVVKPMVKPAAIPPIRSAVSVYWTQTKVQILELPPLVPRSSALKAPVAPVSTTAASLSFEKLKQLQSRP